eukprot:1022506_1
MMMSLKLLLCSILCFITMIERSQTQRFVFRNAELSGVKVYDLIEINLEAFPSESIIEFDAFNQHYTIKLTLDETAIPSNIRHNIDPSQHSLDPYFTSSTTSCHYFGHLLSTNQFAVISISICNKRGIRGRIASSNGTFIIKPSAYFFDPNNSIPHHPTDPHLIYKLPDDPLSNDIHSTSLPLLHTQNTRRRLTTYNNGNNVVELYILSDPARTHRYINKQENDGDWYENLAADLVDLVSWVSAEYMQANWGSSVGRIRTKLVEIEIAHDYNDIYEVLQPSCSLKDKPDQEISCDQCWLNTSLSAQCLQSGPLFSFTAFLDQHKTLDSNNYWADFDLPIFSSAISTAKRTGASAGTLCGSWHNRPIAVTMGLLRASTIGHEIGHCFGMNHDWVSGCEPVNQGLIMNYGWTRSGFSNCSVAELQRTFENSADDMACLSEPTQDDGLAITDPGDHCHGDKCVEIGSLVADLNDKRYNKKWIAVGCDTNNNHYYTADGVNDRYLCYNKENERWIVTILLCDYAERVAFCLANTRFIKECTNDWVVKHSETAWVRDQSVMISACVVNDTVELDNSTRCLSELEERLCIDNEYTLWNGEAEFVMMEGVCSFGEPVYQYAVYNTSDILVQYDDVGSYEGPAIKRVYYLRYVDVVSIPQWIISLDDMTGTGEAICYKSDIRQCDASNWFLQNVIDEIAIDEVDYDYHVLSDIVDPLMTVMNECGVESIANESLEDWQVVVFVAVSSVVCIVIVGSMCFWIKIKNKKMIQVPNEMEMYVASDDQQTDGIHVIALCTDCDLTKEGKTYGADQLFYCLDCWTYYEGSGGELVNDWN